MKKERTDDIIEQAIVRKGEQEALGALSQVESTDRLRELMHAAERKHRPVWLRRRVWAAVSAAAVVAVVLTTGLQPRYSTGELYNRWSPTVVYEPVVSRGEDVAWEAFESALSLAEAGKSAEAMEKFALIAADPASEYAPDARWQLALLYLKTGERDNARKELNLIVSGQGEYGAQAGELLDDMKRRRWF